MCRKDVHSFIASTVLQPPPDRRSLKQPHSEAMSSKAPPDSVPAAAGKVTEGWYKRHKPQTTESPPTAPDPTRSSAGESWTQRFKSTRKIVPLYAHPAIPQPHASERHGLKTSFALSPAEIKPWGGPDNNSSGHQLSAPDGEWTRAAAHNRQCKTSCGF